jgi:hypothetical protein
MPPLFGGGLFPLVFPAPGRKDPYHVPEGPIYVGPLGFIAGGLVGILIGGNTKGGKFVSSKPNLSRTIMALLRANRYRLHATRSPIGSLEHHLPISGT